MKKKLVCLLLAVLLILSLMPVLTACSKPSAEEYEPAITAEEYEPAITDETMSGMINVSIPFTWQYLNHDENFEYYSVTVDLDYVGNETDKYAVFYGNNYGPKGLMMTDSLSLSEMKGGVKAKIALKNIEKLGDNNRMLRVENYSNPVTPTKIVEADFERETAYIMDFIQAFNEGKFQYVSSVPASYEWGKALASYPFFQLVHAYDCYCSALNNMGRFGVYKVDGGWCFNTDGETALLTPKDIKDQNSKTFEKANTVVEDLEAGRNTSLSEYEKAKETLAYIHNIMHNAANVGGYGGMSQMKRDSAYGALVQNTEGGGYGPAFNILMQLQGIESYGLMYTNRGRHSGACLASLDGRLYICDPVKNEIFSLTEIPSTWNLYSDYGNFNILSKVMGFEITADDIGVNPSSLGRTDTIEAGDGAFDIYVDYLSSDADGNDTYMITAVPGSDRNPSAMFNVYYGFGSRIIIGEPVSYAQLKSGVDVIVSAGNKKRINPQRESNVLFVEATN